MVPRPNPTKKRRYFNAEFDRILKQHRQAPQLRAGTIFDLNRHFFDALRLTPLQRKKGSVILNRITFLQVESIQGQEKGVIPVKNVQNALGAILSGWKETLAIQNKAMSPAEIAQFTKKPANVVRRIRALNPLRGKKLKYTGTIDEVFADAISIQGTKLEKAIGTRAFKRFLRLSRIGFDQMQKQ